MLYEVITKAGDRVGGQAVGFAIGQFEDLQGDRLAAPGGVVQLHAQALLVGVAGAAVVQVVAVDDRPLLLDFGQRLVVQIRNNFV